METEICGPDNISRQALQNAFREIFPGHSCALVFLAEPTVLLVSASHTLNGAVPVLLVSASHTLNGAVPVLLVSASHILNDAVLVLLVSASHILNDAVLVLLVSASFQNM